MSERPTGTGTAGQPGPPQFPAEWGAPAVHRPPQPVSAIQMPAGPIPAAQNSVAQMPVEWRDSSPARPGPADGAEATVSRDVGSGLVDFVTIVICSAIAVAAFSPLRFALGLSTSVRNLSRRDALTSVMTDQDYGGLALQVLGLQALLILISIWIFAVPIAFAYTSLATTIAGGTLGRLVTRTRLRTQEGLPLRGGAVARTGLSTALMWLVPPLVLVDAVVFVGTLGKKRLRLGQRMAGTHAVMLVSKGNGQGTAPCDHPIHVIIQEETT